MALIAISCDSLLLRKALERTLKNKLAPINRCDLIVADRAFVADKPLLIIGEHIPKPFSGESLLSAIDRFEALERAKSAAIGLLGAEFRRDLDEKISALTKRYIKELLELLRSR
ncbi:MAG: hypothetical protein LBF86_00275 [Helicobacteraceae bacterium]|jgi:hypothetical protein|nr:hypothetical protein [Helicobacteraceae bacterium]